MERTLIGDVKTKIGETVKIQGWLQKLRDQKSMQFLIMRDRTGSVQAAFWKKATSNWLRRSLPWAPKAP